MLYKNFWKYYGMGCDRDDSYDVDGNFNDLPNDFYYRTRTRTQWNQQIAENPEKYNAANYPEVFNFANTDASLGIIEVYKTQGDDFSIDNLWENWGLNGKLMPQEGGEADWKKAYLFNWLDDDTGIAKQNADALSEVTSSSTSWALCRQPTFQNTVAKLTCLLSHR